MGAFQSCGSSEYESFEDGFEALIMRTISFKGDEVNSVIRSLSFNGRDSEPTVLRAFGSRKMLFEGSLSFKGREPDRFHKREREDCTKVNRLRASRLENSEDNVQRTCDAEQDSPKHRAAVRLQKVYKSFRTRRKLADCAVLVEQRWWKLLDFAMLKRSSVSFFDTEGQESVISRWSRARTRAAMVGKGLSKDEKARKLALQHWLEAIDPRHRYGHNLHFYYVNWLQCESRQPFFYWLDVGEGKEVNLERCPRSKLHQQCIKYLGPKEREQYEVIVQSGRFVYKQSGKLLDTSESPESKWIFVLSTTRKLYVGQKRKGLFQHSSFLAGAATSAAGRLVVEQGILKAVWPHSGHYRPTEENFQELVSFLEENNVDLSDVKKSPTEEEEETCSRSISISNTRSNSSRLSSTNNATEPVTENAVAEQEGNSQQSSEEKFRTEERSSNKPSSINKITVETAFDRLYNICIQNLFRGFEGESDEDSDDNKTKETKSTTGSSSRKTDSTDKESPKECEEFQKHNLFEESNETNEPDVPCESILQRINSKKGMNSLQLGRQLSCKWSTGAGPRIGFVRDYPSELQFQALEEVNLSPRSEFRLKNGFSPRYFPSSSPRSPGMSFLKETSFAAP